jgi:hypothetical protein
MVDAGFHVVQLASGVFVLAGNLDLSRTAPDAVWTGHQPEADARLD